ncbi:MAG: AMP-binding protein [Pseudomonadota bacterium]
MLKKFDSLSETRAQFRWDIPKFFNIGVDICDRPAAEHPDRVALIDIDATGQARDYNFAALRDMSNQLANLLQTSVSRGERIAVLLPQCVETAVVHIASAKLGAIALPLFTLFGPDALRFRLQDSGAKTVVTDRAGFARLGAIRQDLPNVAEIFVIDGPVDGARDFHAELASQACGFEPVKTRAEDPALLIYTSGTTGSPKGALHAHRVLLGHLPGVEMSHDFLPQPGDKIWTPADWAWIGGLLDVLMPSLHHGVPVVAHRFAKFDPEAAFSLIERHHIRNAFLPPTALKLMRGARPEGTSLQMRSVASGGEMLGASLLDWGRDAFGVTINEFYGQTECNMIVSACAALASSEPGALGTAVPGHEVAILELEAGKLAPPEHEGQIAVATPDPVMFLRYWNNTDATEAKFADCAGRRWLLTGDRGYLSASGHFRFIGRNDDVISSAGYRIGPGEVEDCLNSHQAVQLSAVIGKPDPLRGEIVVAYVVLTAGSNASAQLANELQDHVKTLLSPHEYPREVHFVNSLPMTMTGKIMRGALRAALKTGDS